MEALLRDGTPIHFRPTGPHDQCALVAFYAGLSQQSRTFRFFSGGGNFDEVVRRMLDVDQRSRFGLVATAGDDGALVAHGFYAAGPGSDTAEVALAVCDDLQGKGVGTILLAHLTAAAASAGIREFEAEVMCGNDKMTRVFLDSGFPIRRRFSGGAIHFEFPTTLGSPAHAGRPWIDRDLRPLLGTS